MIEGSGEEVDIIAELVSFRPLEALKANNKYKSFPKARREQEATILRALKVLFSIGSLLEDKILFRLLHVMSRSTVALTTNEQARYYVLLALTGQIPSKQQILLTRQLTGQYYTCRIKAKLRNGEIVVSGDQWPLFLYADYRYDSEDPWNGICRSALLVSVCTVHIRIRSLAYFTQAYKHIFTSPSSVDKEPKATRSGNARIHGMTRVTPPSVAYIATQVRAFIDCMPVIKH